MNKILNVITKPFRRLFSFFGAYGNRAGRVRFHVLLVFVLAIIAGSFDYSRPWNKSADFINLQKNKVQFVNKIPNIPQFTQQFPFRLGLDLLGGTHLVYEADLSQINQDDYSSSMDGVRDVIERRVNLFGVTEPLVQVNKVGNHYRLIVELAGIKDVNQAIKMIGETPMLQFKTEQATAERDRILAKYLTADEVEQFKDEICLNGQATSAFLVSYGEDPCYAGTELTGKYLDNAETVFDQNTGVPQVSLQFNDEGAQIFQIITKINTGKTVAIYLDGLPISMPRVQEEIIGGKAQITGKFTTQEVKELVQRLNAGALPVPITLVNQQTVGASLGNDSLQKSLRAGLYGLLAVAIFMILYYRLPGLLSVVALGIYTVITLAIFKLGSVTMTLAGIAGFILSVGMAVDANVLVFERIKEEFKAGRGYAGAVEEGFWRAWLSIRDSNASSLITCVILFWIGTSIVKGFALTLGIGILVSMFSAIVVTRSLLKIFIGTRVENWRFLFNAPKK
ncbi:MAG: protein translocase subunit SecD [Candidatus Portnoybacteria bacterium CG10_big_fil_rev_8_21_14_0_10_36_7]|uniref:Protein translocase subunit SecD n=1 Tax=Candidatus Portnoybacteria bacterium CG10_big_fil_rev_8_21_14_0_10_36_7 TaxID=1974812 RepID=A0A2M8KEH2_9BACT|nr:MAG: protein translocase subunit SecD [Candidatus Portnoybacteria bacterium CG10_big_fil_rev_8_21_14_0_10_36_7]